MSRLLSLRGLRDTASLAREVAGALRGREALLLSGDLGAGKTTFARYLARALGIDPAWVSSPSFTLVQRYPPGEAGVGITHVDLYRLSEGSELEGLGLEEAWDGPDLILVEWPELLEKRGIPPGREIHRLTFASGPGCPRAVTWEGPATDP